MVKFADFYDGVNVFLGGCHHVVSKFPSDVSEERVEFRGINFLTVSSSEVVNCYHNIDVLIIFLLTFSSTVSSL